MAGTEEPSYLAFARANVRGGAMTSPLIVESLLARIDRDAFALPAAPIVQDDAWKRGYDACKAGEQRHSPYQVPKTEKS